MISGGKVKLFPKRLDDAVRDYAWQTDSELSRLDASSPLTVGFNRYLLEYTVELGSKAQCKYQFAIDTIEGEHIGNCAYYDIGGQGVEAEIGIMIGDRCYWNRGYGADAVTALVNYIFDNTAIERIFLKTLDFNHRAQRCFARCGFTVCGELVKGGHSFVLMELYRCRWQGVIKPDVNLRTAARQ